MVRRCMVLGSVGVGAVAAPVVAAAAPAGGLGPAGTVAGIFAAIVGIVLLTALELLVMALAPSPVTAARDVLVRRRGSSLLAGAATLLLGLGLAALFSHTKGGSEVIAILILALILVGIVLGFPAIALTAGRAVLGMSARQEAPSDLTAAIVGLLLTYSASLVPILGWALFVLLCLFSLGSVVLAAAESRTRAPRSRPLPPSAGEA